MAPRRRNRKNGVPPGGAANKANLQRSGRKLSYTGGPRGEQMANAPEFHRTQPNTRQGLLLTARGRPDLLGMETFGELPQEGEPFTRPHPGDSGRSAPGLDESVVSLSSTASLPQADESLHDAWFRLSRPGRRSPLRRLPWSRSGPGVWTPRPGGRRGIPPRFLESRAFGFQRRDASLIMVGRRPRQGLRGRRHWRRPLQEQPAVATPRRRRS